MPFGNLTKFKTTTMKTYRFILSVYNSTIIEVQAENYTKAEASALHEFHESEIIHDLCNPKDMSVDIELD